MRNVIKTPHEFIWGLHNSIQLIGKSKNILIISALVDWEQLDAVPHAHGFFDGLHDCFIEVHLPVNLLSNKGKFTSTVTLRICAFSWLRGHQFYVENPYAETSPKKYMFTQEDYSGEVVCYVEDNFLFKHGFYCKPTYEPTKLMHVATQDVFDLNVHYILSQNFKGAFPFIASAGVGLEDVFAVYYGYWLHTLRSLKYAQENVEDYRKTEVNLQSDLNSLKAPYSAFIEDMNKEYRSKFNPLKTNVEALQRRFVVEINKSGFRYFIFMSPYVCVAVSLDKLKTDLVYDLNRDTKPYITDVLKALDIAPFTRLVENTLL